MTGQTKRVLIVDDFDDSRISLAKLMEMEGYSVMEAADGQQAIEMATANPPDIILMDLTLPVVSGLDATRRLRGDANFGAVPIIALTAHDSYEVKAGAREAGFTDFVTKPVDFDRLLSLVARYTNH